MTHHAAGDAMVFSRLVRGRQHIPQQLDGGSSVTNEDLDRPADDEGHSLVMPFVNVHSVGGVFDDEAFAAGWECGRADAALSSLDGMKLHGSVTMTVRTANIAQLDLIAMRYNATTRHQANWESNEWVEWTATRGPSGGER